jgi:hypothetical protein
MIPSMVFRYGVVRSQRFAIVSVAEVGFSWVPEPISVTHLSPQDAPLGFRRRLPIVAIVAHDIDNGMVVVKLRPLWPMLPSSWERTLPTRIIGRVDTCQCPGAIISAPSRAALELETVSVTTCTHSPIGGILVSSEEPFGIRSNNEASSKELRGSVGTWTKPYEPNQRAPNSEPEWIICADVLVQYCPSGSIF